MIYYLTYGEDYCKMHGEKAISNALMMHIFDLKGIENYCIKRKENGKPYLEGNPFYFNISHTKGFCAIAISEMEIGLDLEKKDRKMSQKLLRRICLESEYNQIGSDEDMIKMWVLKEACAKYTGRGILQLLEGIELDYKKLESKDGLMKCSLYQIDEIVMATCQKKSLSHELRNISLQEIESYL